MSFLTKDKNGNLYMAPYFIIVKCASINIAYKNRKVITNPKTGDGKPLLNTYSTDNAVETKIINIGKEMYANNLI